MYYTVTEVADLLGKSSNSVKHILEDNNIQYKDGIDEEALDKLKKHYLSIGLEYMVRGVKDNCPDGYILSSQDIHEISGILQPRVGHLCRKGVLDGALVNTHNGPCWYVTEESIDRYMNLNHIPYKEDSSEIITKARFDRYKEHLFSNKELKQLSEHLGVSKEEAIEKAIRFTLKEAMNG